MRAAATEIGASRAVATRTMTDDGSTGLDAWFHIRVMS
jgi:hypothetical protein